MTIVYNSKIENKIFQNSPNDHNTTTAPSSREVEILYVFNLLKYSVFSESYMIY